MRRLLVLLIALALAAPAFGNIGGSFVQLVSPTVVVPGQTQTFTFWVYNASTDGEWIQYVEIYFVGYTVHPSTMGSGPYVFPSTSWWPSIGQAQWSGTAVIPPLQGGNVWIDVTVPLEGYQPFLPWQLGGDGTGASPHMVEGVIDVVISPVESASWTAIKMMYR